MRQETKTKAGSLATQSGLFCDHTTISSHCFWGEKQMKFTKQMIILPNWAFSLLHLCWELLLHKILNLIL